MKMKKAWFVRKKGLYLSPDDEYDFLGFGEEPRETPWYDREYWADDPFYIWVPIQATEESARRQINISPHYRT